MVDRDGEPTDGLVGVPTGETTLQPPRGGMPARSIVRDLAPDPALLARGVRTQAAWLGPVLSSSERQLLRLRELEPNAPTSVLIEVESPTFDWRSLGRADGGTPRRNELLELRREQVRTATGSVVARLEAVGARDVAAGDLSAIVRAVIPARLANDVAGWPRVRSIQRDEPRGTIAQYGGAQARAGMRTSTFQSNGILGNGPGRNVDSRIRFAIVDLENQNLPLATNNWPSWSHDGYLRTTSYFPWVQQNRWKKANDCLGTSCIVYSGAVSTWPTGNTVTHSNRVARVLFGNVENYNYSGLSAFDRTQRSGIATEGDLYYYRVAGSSWSLSVAIDQLIVDGIDVANFSIGVSSDPLGCHLDSNSGTANQSIENATQAGVLLVAAIGNDGRSMGRCLANYPAMNRNTLAVAGLNTTSTANYDTSLIWPDSSRGGMSVLTTSSGRQTFAIADISAPAIWMYEYTPGLHDFATTAIAGTSYAAPAVAAAAGLLRESFNTIGWNLNDARTLLVNMILLGDGFQDWYGGQLPYGMDLQSGAGRLHAHAPIVGDMVSPWGWGWHVARLGPGEELRFPVWDGGAEDVNVQQWKSAMTWVEPSTSGSGTTIPVADIVLEVWDTCAPGGPVSVSSDYSFDIRKRLSLSHTQIVLPTRSRCLEGRVRVFDIPVGSANPIPGSQPRTRDVYVADYFHGGNPSNH